MKISAFFWEDSHKNLNFLNFWPEVLRKESTEKSLRDFQLPINLLSLNCNHAQTH